jgi:hypothetical protein
MSEALETVKGRIARIEAALALLDQNTREPPPGTDDDPVFIASIGWRSGSTLMQRLLMTDPSILIWGEPLDRMLLISQLTDAVSTVDPFWPRPDAWINNRDGADLTREWVANLYPDPGRLRAGFRAMLDAWLGEPARARGHQRWGAKEVRWTAADGLVLRWLYPRCRFVVILRHPVASYYSMRNFGAVPLGPEWALRTPDRIVAYEAAYGRMWNEMTLGWLEVADRLGARVIRYEDLIEGRIDGPGLSQELGLDLKPEIALSTKVGGSPYSLLITEDEKVRINAETTEARQRMAYAE